MREKKIILEYQMSHLNTIFLDFFFFFYITIHTTFVQFFKFTDAFDQ